VTVPGQDFLPLADRKQGAGMDWILTSGFTQEELVSIQKPFMGVSNRPHMPIETGPALAQAPTMPMKPLKPVIDATLRKAETARLLAKYKGVDKQLTAKQKKSLDLAVDRLMAKPELAWQFVHPGV